MAMMRVTGFTGVSGGAGVLTSLSGLSFTATTNTSHSMQVMGARRVPVAHVRRKTSSSSNAQNTSKRVLHRQQPQQQRLASTSTSNQASSTVSSSSSSQPAAVAVEYSTWQQYPFPRWSPQMMHGRMSHTITTPVPTDYTDVHDQSSNQGGPQHSMQYYAESWLRSTSTAELVRGILLGEVCRMKPLVANADRLIHLSRSVLGNKLTDFVMRHSFFNHFCGGETHAEVIKTIKHLESQRIGSILDYAAEAPVGPDGLPIAQVASTYNSADEEKEFDLNVEISKQAIQTAAASKGEGFAAVKITALVNVEALLQVSTVLCYLEEQFIHAMAVANAAASESTQDMPIGNISRYTLKGPRPSMSSIASVTGKMDLALFQAVTDLPREEAEKIFVSLDKNEDSLLGLNEWLGAVWDADMLSKVLSSMKKHHITRVSSNTINTTPLLVSVLPPEVSPVEVAKITQAKTRMYTLAEMARDEKVRLMVDAEDSLIQPGIDFIVLHTMKRFNKERAVIYSTYQMYLKNSFARINLDMHYAAKSNVIFAAKLVRGAYMDLERKRAHDNQVESVVHDTYEDTSKSYHDGVDFMLQNIDRASLMVASHNEESVRYAASKLARMPERHRNEVFFAQLLGMGDSLTSMIKAQGLNVYKYVPYGPIGEVMPYLIRRAQENSQLADSESSIEDRRFARNELWKRMTNDNVQHQQ